MTERLIFKRCSSSCIALYFNRLICRCDISDCLAGLDLYNLVITDAEIAYSDCTLCVGSKSLIVALSGLGCAGYSELPATENTVCTSLDYLYTALLRSIGELVVAVD